MAIGSGTDVAIESAGIVLVNSNPLDVAKLFKLSHASYRKMIQNLWWAAGYNIFAIHLSAGVPCKLGHLAFSGDWRAAHVTEYHYCCHQCSVIANNDSVGLKGNSPRFVNVRGGLC